MIHLLVHGAGLAGLAGLFLLTGQLVETVWPAAQEAGVDRRLRRLLLGVGVWCVVLFVLAAAGGLQPALIWILVAAVVAAASRVWGRDAAWIPAVPARWWEWIVPAGVLAGLFVSAASPFLYWDDDVYHLTLPRLYAAAGGFRPVPLNVYASWPLNVELLFTLALLLQDYILAKLVHFGFLVALAAVAYRVTEKSAPGWGAVGVALLLANDVVLLEGAIAYVDIACAFFFAMGVAFAAVHVEGGGRAPLFAAGIALGLLAGSKLSGVFGLVAVAAMVLIETRSLRPVAVLAVPALLLAAPWYVRCFLETGDPVFPLLFPILGGNGWTEELHRQFTSWQAAYGMGRRPLDYLLLPLRVVLASRRFGHEITLAWVLLVPLVLMAARRHPNVRRLAVAAAVYFAMWAASSQQMRFLIPVLALLAPAAAVGLADLSGRGRLRLARGTVILASMLLLAHEARPHLADAFAVGERLLEDGRALRRDAVPPAYAFVNQQTPPGSRLLLVNVNRGFFLKREYVADSFFEASQTAALLREARDADGVEAVLDRLGITHVIVAKKEWGIAYPRAWSAFLEDPVRARPRYDDRDFTVYARPTRGKGGGHGHHRPREPGLRGGQHDPATSHGGGRQRLPALALVGSPPGGEGAGSRL